MSRKEFTPPWGRMAPSQRLREELWQFNGRLGAGIRSTPPSPLVAVRGCGPNRRPCQIPDHTPYDDGKKDSNTQVLT